MPLNGRELANRFALEGRLRVSGDEVIVVGEQVDPKLRKAIDAYFRGEDAKPDPQKAASINKKYALGAIRRVWRDQGAGKSKIGWPIGRYIKVHPKADGTFKARFRSGTMTVAANGKTVFTTVDNYVKVTFVGLECQIRQEGEDELYGVVAVVGPANSAISTHKFPGGDDLITLGPGGQRIWQTAKTLYDGPIENLYITCNLIEQDSGDVDAISKSLADKIISASEAILGGMTGVSAEDAIAEETWFQDGFGQAIGFVLDGILGMGDDPYNPAAIEISWHEIVDGIEPQSPYKRGDDPRVIKSWTHSVAVSGTDNGGDTGQYMFYFNVETYHKGGTRTTGLEQ